MCQAFKFPGNDFRPEGERLVRIERSTTTMVTCLFVCFSVIIRSINDQSIDPRYLENRVLYAHPGPASCSRNMCISAGHGGGGWAAIVLKAEID